VYQLEFIKHISFDVYAEIAEMLFFYLSLISHVFFLNSLSYYVGIFLHSVDRLADPLPLKPLAYDFLGRFSIENLYLGSFFIFRALLLGTVTGYPGVFQSNPCPCPSKPAPVSTGTGFCGYG
jgi:hypothetical protein